MLPTREPGSGVPVRALLVRIPLGPRPSLHRHRCDRPRRRLRRGLSSLCCASCISPAILRHAFASSSFTPLSGSPKKISIASPTNLSIVPPSLSAILDLDESTFKVHKRPSCVVPSREVRRCETPTGSHNLICKQGGPQFAALLPCLCAVCAASGRGAAMSKVLYVVACGLILAACSGSAPNWGSFFGGSTPPPEPAALRLESHPPGAEAKSSLGPSCRTPCALPVAGAGGKLRGHHDAQRLPVADRADPGSGVRGSGRRGCAVHAEPGVREARAQLAEEKKKAAKKIAAKPKPVVEAVATPEPDLSVGLAAAAVRRGRAAQLPETLGSQ